MTKEKRKGFTLIEVLVASVILVVCMAGIMNSFAAGAYFKKNTEEITNATFLAQELMNGALNPNAPDVNDVEEEQPCHYPFEEYTYKFKVKKFNEASLNQITVQVMTPHTAKLRRTIELTALKIE